MINCRFRGKMVPINQSPNHPITHMSLDYLDVDITISPQAHGAYEVAVRSSAGEAQAEVTFPFTDAQLEAHLLRLENAILRSSGSRRQRLTPEEEAIQEFGRQLFDFALPGDARSIFDSCRREAELAGKGTRVRLRIRAPQLAALPWKFLYDARRRDYLCLDVNTPVVRYVELSQAVRPLSVAPPLRILGMVASPADLSPIDVEQERVRVQQALAGLVHAGTVEWVWVDGQTARDLQRATRAGAGPWHVFHLVSHGGYDRQRDEGVVVLAGDDGRPHEIGSQQLSRILAGQRPTLRLVVLNACEGARGGMEDIFSSTATSLVSSGAPAVLAMQYAITSGAAVEFAQAFYEGLAAGQPVDAAVTEGRNAINLRDRYSLEWGTPVLHLRAADGVIFRLEDLAAPAADRQHPAAGLADQGRVVQIGGDYVVGDKITVGDVAGSGVAIGRQAQAAAGSESAEVAQPPAERDRAPATARPAAPPAPKFPIDFDWVTIPAGEFLMGSDKAQDSMARDAETPQHRIHLPEYRIARVAVTVAQFSQFVQATGYRTDAEKAGSAWSYTGKEWADVKGAYWAKPRGPKSSVEGKQDHPVTCVSWNDAVAFCRWAQVRLPTEAEWEKAARGTDGRIWPWGDDQPTEKLCNFEMNVKDTTPVGSYPAGASPYGVLDMAGNVWEWTSSLYKRYRYDANDGREEAQATGPRVLRGGAFSSDRYYVRCAVRDYRNPDSRNVDVGFRVVSPGL